MDAGAWGRWWKDNQETFKYPARSIDPPYRSVALSTSSETYYGLPLFAEKLVFVLDTSGSMSGQRIVSAKRELVRAIEGLPNHTEFAVVVFNGTVDVWQRQLAKATPASKKAAIHYVNAQDPHSNTASYDALEAAMSFDTEAIYFLSDGAPHGGKISAPVDIVAAISTANHTRKISMYTIGIGAGFPGSPLDVFLKTLAEKNYGVYRRVDN
jgi:Ca-activated chloride channel family protein